MIHVCYGLHDKDGRYSKFTGTSMLSMLENYNTPPPSITVHILHDNTLTAGNLQKLVSIAKQYNQLIKFYNVEQFCAERIAEFRRLIPRIKNSPLSIGTLYRLLMMDVLSADINKILYFDSDTIINLDVSEMWAMELGDKPLAAVSETLGTGLPAEQYLPLCRENIIKSEDYFNAGILIINLEQIRKEKDTLQEGILFRASRPQDTSMDQEILNYCFATRALKLPLDFNVQVHHSRRRGDYRVDNRICHYISCFKGIGVTMNMNDSFNRLFMKYFVKTPFFNEDVISHLYEGAKQIYIDRQNFAIKISAIISGKTRGFFVSKQNVTAAKNIFFVGANEEFVVEETRESLQKVIKSLNRSRGKKVFILLIDEYDAVYNILTEAGFVYERDFLNGLDFLSDDNGVPLNSYQLVKVL